MQYQELDPGFDVKTLVKGRASSGACTCLTFSEDLNFFGDNWPRPLIDESGNQVGEAQGVITPIAPEDFRLFVRDLIDKAIYSDKSRQDAIEAVAVPGYSPNGTNYNFRFIPTSRLLLPVLPEADAPWSMIGAVRHGIKFESIPPVDEPVKEGDAEAARSKVIVLETGLTASTFEVLAFLQSVQEMDIVGGGLVRCGFGRSDAVIPAYDEAA